LQVFLFVALLFFIWTRCCIGTNYYALVSVIPLQHRSCSVCLSFIRLGHHNG